MESKVKSCGERDSERRKTEDENGEKKQRQSPPKSPATLLTRSFWSIQNIL